MADLLEKAKAMISNPVTVRDADVEKWLGHLTKLEALKSSLHGRLKMLATKYIDLMIDQADTANEFFQLYASNAQRIDLAQKMVDFADKYKDLSNQTWRNEFKKVIESVELWAASIDSTKSRVLKFEDDLKSVGVLSEKIKVLRDQLSGTKMPNTQDKNDLTASISRLQDLETNLEKYRGQARQMVKTLIEERFVFCDKIFLGLARLQKLFFQQVAIVANTELVPLISELEEISTSVETLQATSNSNGNDEAITQPKIRGKATTDILDGISELLVPISAPVVQSKANQSVSNLDPLADLFSAPNNQRAPAQTDFLNFSAAPPQGSYQAQGYPQQLAPQGFAQPNLPQGYYPHPGTNPNFVNAYHPQQQGYIYPQGYVQYPPQQGQQWR